MDAQVALIVVAAVATLVLIGFWLLARYDRAKGIHNFAPRVTTAYAETVPAASPAPGMTMTRRYRGSYNEATEVFERDRQQLAGQSWVAVSQSYVPGQWGTGAWVAAFALLILVIGIIVLAYMIAVKPDGELVVTYEYRPPQAAPTPPEPAAVPDPTDQLRKLAELRDAGIITPEEFEAKKAEILARM